MYTQFRITKNIAVIILCLCITGCGEKGQPTAPEKAVYIDAPYLQDYSVKYNLADSNTVLYKVYEDRNGVIKIFTSKGIMQPCNGEMLYPGKISPDSSYRAIAAKKIQGLGLYKKQFVYLDDKAVLSNAWAGKLYLRHTLPSGRIFCGGDDFSFLVSNGKKLQYLKDTALVWQAAVEDSVLDMQYNKNTNSFFVLSTTNITVFSADNKRLSSLYKGDGLTCFTLVKNGTQLIVGTHNGYIILHTENGVQSGSINRKLPDTDLTAIVEIDGKCWFGSKHGAFMLKDDSSFNYYASKRWLPSDEVEDIAAGHDGSVLVLTNGGLGKICFKKMTLEDKAAFYDKQVRQRHIRYGLYCDVTRIKNGDLSTGALGPHDSDNLWTAMYLGSQLFRYLVTHDVEAKDNCIEAFEAMERLYTINGIPGYFGRSFERHGVVPFKTEFREYLKDYWYPGYQQSVSWRPASNTEWDWRGASSSDQVVGQMFALTLIAEYIDDDGLRKRAIGLMDGLMSYIVDNNLSLIDADGRPTLWGIWNPAYVNRFPENVGDRKLYSSNIIAFLQTAYHFTQKQKFKTAANELLYKQGYLNNLTRPFKQTGKAPDSADAWSKAMSEGWNHSDDEMYFLAYWGLYPYAFNDTLKGKYSEAMRDHWETERPEKDALWNFCYAITGTQDFDLHESIWFLKEMPMDMTEWAVHNSSRKDITFIPENYRGEQTTAILPPDERPQLKHNRNLFTLDRNYDAGSELGAGDTWLLPYWMGRYLGVISNGHQ
jgi:hypothetical protein